MRHMEPTRRVAVDSLIPSVPLAANPRTGSACACCRAYSLHAIDSSLLPPGTPRADSSVTHPSQDQLCSTSSHRRCRSPAEHTAASPPRLHTSLTGTPYRSTTVCLSPFPQSQPSSRFPSQLLIAYHPLHPSSQRPRSSSPIPYKVLLFCIPISSRTAFVVSQLTPLQNIVQKSWARCACSMYFIPSIVCERPESDVLLPSRPLPALSPTRTTPHACGRLATCHPSDNSPPDHSDLSILSLAPTTSDARPRCRHFSPCRLPHHI
jgi:hypothetical protein